MQLQHNDKDIYMGMDLLEQIPIKYRNTANNQVLYYQNSIRMMHRFLRVLDLNISTRVPCCLVESWKKNIKYQCNAARTLKGDGVFFKFSQESSTLL